VLLISAGIGSTRVLAMLRALAEVRAEREIWWLHSARNRRAHSFAAEAETLLASLPNARRRVYYSRPGPDDVEGRDFDIAGRLTGSALAELEPSRDAEAYLCEPAPFMEEISAAAATLSVPWSQDNGSLLELAEACDVPVRWSCRTGVCHTCETTLIAGDVDYCPDPVEAPAPGSALICCSQPRENLVLDL
jgi:ferredoxin